MRFRRPFALSPLLLLLVLSGSCSEPATGPPLVFAAASLSDVLLELGERFSAEQGAEVAFNFAGSNELARQIEQGAPASLFLSADLRQVERLERQGRLRPEDRVELLGNTLVVVEPLPATTGERHEPSWWTGPSWLLERRSIALADPAAVPAGVYAREWLESLGVWGALQDRLVPTLDVRAALGAVASGAAEAGIVYRTDARGSRRVRRGSRRVRIVHEVPAAEGPRVRYYLSPVPGTPAPASSTAHAFAASLVTAAAAETFRRYGFEPLAVESARASARPEDE